MECAQLFWGNILPVWLDIVKLQEGTGTDNYDGTAGREARRKLKQSWLAAKEQTGGWIEFFFFPPSGKDILLLLLQFEGQMHIKGGTNEHYGCCKQRDV